MLGAGRESSRARARNVIIRTPPDQLRSIPHVCKCKKKRQPLVQTCPGVHDLARLRLRQRFARRKGKIRYFVKNFTNSFISIIHRPASVATSFQSPQRFIRENCSSLLVQFIAGRPTGPLPKGCQYTFDVSNVPQGSLMT